MKITFEEPSKILNIPKVYTHEFRGHNLSDAPVSVTSKTVSCGCTDVNIPDVIYPGSFKASVKVDKSHSNSGSYYGINVGLQFSNGDSVKLSLSGKIK